MLAKCQYLVLTEVGAGFEVGVEAEVDPHLELIDPPPQVPKIVVGVAKDTHLRSAQPITKPVKGAKSRATSNNTAKPKTQGYLPTQGAPEGNNLRYPEDMINHLVTL